MLTLEIIYAFVLGFYLAFAICFIVKDPDDIVKNAMKAAVPLPLFYIGALIWKQFTIAAVLLHWPFLMGGATLGILVGMYFEGTYTWLWRRIHPASAPTEFIGAGQRGGMAKAPPKMSAALMGTSTAAFAVQGLDVKTTALIKLSMHAFKRDRKTIVTIENALRLGDGRRYYVFQKLVADAQFEKSLTDIIHPYWRAINGNHSSARLMFTNLCQLARDSGNTNKRAVNRLVQIGQSLGLSPEDMGRAIGNVRG